jgi:hypothetical protein
MNKTPRTHDEQQKYPPLQDGIHVVPRSGEPGFERCPCGALVLQGVTPTGARVWLSAALGHRHRCQEAP